MKTLRFAYFTWLGLLAPALPAIAGASPDNSSSTPPLRQQPSAVYVERRDFGHGPLTEVSTPQLSETFYFDQQGNTPTERVLELTLENTDALLVRKSININGDIVKSTGVERFNKITREQDISTYTAKGRHLYTFHSAPGQPGTYLDAEGKPISQQQADQLYLACQEDQIDLAKVLRQNSPFNHVPSTPQNPNEVRVWRHGSEYSRGIMISMPGLNEIVTYSEDGKMLVERILFSTHNTDKALVMESIVLHGNTVSYLQTKSIQHKDSKTEIITSTPAGNLLFSEHESPGQPRVITDRTGKTISRARSLELLNSPNPDQIDLDKVPVHDMTNLGQAPAAGPTPQAE